MSKVKKSLLVLPLLFVLLVSSMMLSACGKPAVLTLSEDLASKANAVVDDIVENVYDAAVLKDDLGDDGEEKFYYTVSEIQNLIPNTEFYVEVGTFKNIKNLEKITIGGYTLKAGDDIAISVGNNNYIKDDAFVVDGDKLLVSANIVAFEAIYSNKIKLNDTEFDFNIQEKTDNVLSVTSLEFNLGKNTIEKLADDTYKLTIINGTDALLIDYDGKEDTDIVFTRKVVDGVLTGYGVTKLDSAKGGKYFMYYPIWADTEALYNEARQAKDGKTLVYDFFVAGKGVARLNFTFDIAEYSAENNA